MKNPLLLTALALPVFLLPVPCAAQSAKNQPSEAKPTPKVLGIHCAERQGWMVGLHLCQQIIDTVRHGTAYTVRNCPDVLDKNQELHITCLPKNDANLMLYVGRNWELSSDDEEQPVGMNLVDVASGKTIFTVPPDWRCVNFPPPEQHYDSTTQDSAWCAVNRVISFIAKQDKQKPKAKE